MSGGTSITPGHTWTSVETVTAARLNKMVRDAIVQVSAGAITARELADGSISADKLAVELEAQLGVADGSVTTAKIVDLAVTTAKLADLAVTTAKLADLAVTAAKIAAGAVTETKLGQFTSFLVHNNNVDISFTRGVNTALALSTATRNIGGGWAAGKFTAPGDGLYLLGGAVALQGSPYPYAFWSGLRYNAGTIWWGTGGHDNTTGVPFSTVAKPFELSAGDTMELIARQNGTGTGTVDGQLTNTYFWGLFHSGL